MNKEINSHFGKIQNFYNETNFGVEVTENKTKEEKSNPIPEKKEEEIEKPEVAEELAKKLRVEEISNGRYYFNLITMM